MNIYALPAILRAEKKRKKELKKAGRKVKLSGLYLLFEVFEVAELGFQLAIFYAVY